VPSDDVVGWIAESRGELDRHLLTSRAVLMRGIGDLDAGLLQDIVAAADSERLEYVDRSTPRAELADKVYESTSFPADQEIVLHNEGTYWLQWPLRIWFGCVTPAERGGDTPIADTREVMARIPAEIVDKARRLGVRYVRNYNAGFGLSWEETFQTSDRAAVESYCSENGIDLEWLGDDRLRTVQHRPAIRTHPVTGDELWFNHAAFFNIHRRDEDTREALLEVFAEDELPFNTYYGDGSPFSAEEIASIASAYAAVSRSVAWQAGDLLLLDNMTVAHGRHPYEGERRIVVAMSDPCAS
jgi:alpha-ketoglutarate-dependent taurine dioxygenase